MTENKAQEHDKAKLRESIFAKEKTYGEKKYDFLFGNVTNFWINLLTSAGFAYWVRHAGPTKNPLNGKTFEPSEVQNKAAGWLERNLNFPATKAASVVNILTLLTPGHIVMIPSVYFGEKYKAGIVKHFNRKHYGDAAMESEELRTRHAQIERAEKPTVWGTVVARAGTAVINSTVTYAVGTEDNWLRNKVPGMGNFKGLDHIADRGGVAIGTAVETAAPKFFEKATTRLSRNMKYSSEQIARAEAHPITADPSLAKINDGKPYNSGFNNLLRYITQDVIYTVIAAGVVHPIINVLKHVVPGMTYKPKVKHPTPVETPIPAKRYHFDEAQIAPLPNEQQLSNAPSTSVQSIEKQSTITERNEHALAGANV